MTLRTDMAIVPNPEPGYPWPIANSQAVDPDFGTNIVRITDINTTGRVMQTCDAGQENLFNTNSTLLVLKADGGRKYLFSFDPVHLKATKLPFTYTGALTFSRINPQRLYQVLGTQLQALNFREVAGVWEMYQSVNIYDFAEILPAGFKPMWNSVFMCSGDDESFTLGYSEGVQNTGSLVCNFTRGKGGKLLDTSKTIPSFLLHEVYQTPAADKVILEGATGYRIIWGVHSGVWEDISPVSGHSSHGNLCYRSGGPGNGQMVQLTYANPSVHSMVVKGPLPSPLLQSDKHFSQNHLDPNDENPYIASTLNAKDGIVITAWQGEILRYNPATGVVERICHHLSLPSNIHFDVANAMAIQSQDGKFIAFCSDLMGTIGGDVFIAVL